jgi:hypothetical protein
MDASLFIGEDQVIILIIGSLALNLFVTYKILELEQEIKQKLKTRHGTLRLAHTRKTKKTKESESQITTQNIPLFGRRFNNG